jgi:hypothetical protein
MMSKKSIIILNWKEFERDRLWSNRRSSGGTEKTTKKFCFRLDSNRTFAKYETRILPLQFLYFIHLYFERGMGNIEKARGGALHLANSSDILRGLFVLGSCYS